MKRSRLITLVLALAIAAVSYLGNQQSNGPAEARSPRHSTPAAGASDSIAEAALPKEARHTLSLIRQGGPFPYEKDGTVFGNREKLLPLKDRGYYREYTVRTPGVSHRGARRIVAGGSKSSPSEFYYTQDHYQSFRRIAEDAR